MRRAFTSLWRYDAQYSKDGRRASRKKYPIGKYTYEASKAKWPLWCAAARLTGVALVFEPRRLTLIGAYPVRELTRELFCELETFDLKMSEFTRLSIEVEQEYVDNSRRMQRRWARIERNWLEKLVKQWFPELRDRRHPAYERIYKEQGNMLCFIPEHPLEPK